MIWLALIAFALSGGWLSRICGGGRPKFPFGLDQWLYAFPYLLIILPEIRAALTPNPCGDCIKYMPFFLAMAGYGTAVSAKKTGHGGGIDLGHSNEEPYNGREPEKLEFLILPLHGKISQYWYDVLLLAITGLAGTVISGLIVALVNPFWGMVLALSGATKGLAYMIGWAIYPDFTGTKIKWLNEATAIGEFLTGFFAYLTIGITAMNVWGL